MSGADLHATLKAKGYRLTPQRQLVLDAVAAPRPRHAGRDLRRGAADRAGVNLSTVYRTLELLEELGLVTHAHLGHGAPTYHAADGGDHLHLVCRDCGVVIETDVELADAAGGRGWPSSTASRPTWPTSRSTAAAGSARS